MPATLEEHKLFVYLAEYNLRLGQGHISYTYALKQLEVAYAIALPLHLSVCRAFRRMSTEASIQEYESCYLTPKGGVFSPDFLKGKRVKRQSVDE